MVLSILKYCEVISDLFIYRFIGVATLYLLPTDYFYENDKWKLI